MWLTAIGFSRIRNPVLVGPPLNRHAPDGPANKEIRRSGKIPLPSPVPFGWNARRQRNSHGGS